MLTNHGLDVLGRWPGLRESGVRKEFLDWFESRVRASRCTVERVALTELRSWRFHQDTGNLVHEDGRFFSVEGLHVGTSYGAVPEWRQPILNQPEIGILGMLVRELDGELHCLVQAKMEPGNANVMQLSPTVQATRSNYTQAHRGSPTRYLGFFTGAGRHRVLVDVLQSEQGSWFLRKRNRNMAVLVDHDVPATEDHFWLSLADLRRLFLVDDLVNMDTRTVLSCLPEPARRPGGAAEHGTGAHLGTPALLRWLTAAKCSTELTARSVPLSRLPGWNADQWEIRHADGLHFSIIGVRVQASSREVAEWDQPLLQPHGQGVVALVRKIIGGVAHVLMHARFQPGLLDAMELGPTVQCMPANHPRQVPRFLDYVLTVPAEQVRYDTLLAEEGGRFYHSENRYMVIEAGEEFPTEVPSDYCWVALDQCAFLLQHSYYVNIEARSVLACLRTVA